MIKFFNKIFRFFFPKDWRAEFNKGLIKGEELRTGKSIKVMPTWWIGKGLRKAIDPKHKIEFKNKNKR